MSDDRGYGSHSVDTANFQIRLWVDGASAEGHATITSISGAAGFAMVHVGWDFLPAAGSHLIGPAGAINTATATLFANASAPLQLTIEELVRQNTPNNVTTSG